MKIFKLFAGCAVCAIALPGAALAQAPQEGAAAEQGAIQDAAEIIVTAQRREQRLQDVPISITSLGGGELTKQGITASRDIAQAVPGLTITESAGYVQPFIRGVGSTATNLGESGSAATYIDGVYMPTVNGQIYQLANIESIQVLKGPQGTLFGRNANTGAIIITTRQPEQELGGSLNASYGNYNAFNANGYITGGLAEGVAVSLAGNYDSRDTFSINRNPNNEFGVGNRIRSSKRYSLRGALLLEPSESLKFTLSADLQRAHDPSPILTQPFGRGYQGFVPGGLFPTGPYDYIGNENADYKAGQEGVSGKIDWDVSDDISISSITAYRHYYSRSFDYDSDTTPFRFASISNNDEGTSFTQEVLVSGKSSALTWVVGGFYLRQDGKQDPLRIDTPAPNPTILIPHQITDALAAFADATLTVGRLELTGGLRYSHETKEFSGTRNGVTPDAYANGPVSKTWTSWTPRAVVAFHANDDAMIYASFAKGFKSGAFNATTLSRVPINPETVEAYEAGFKLTLGRGFTLNGAAFHYITKDLQVQALNPDTNLIELRNAAAVKSDGFDLDAVYSPMRDLTLKLGMSYLKAKFSSFTNAQVFVPDPAFTDGRNKSVIFDVTGRRNVRSPDWTLNVAADYRIDLGGAGSLVPSANVYYSSKFYWTVDNRLSEPSHFVANASLTWNSADERYSVAVFGRNIFDELRFRTVITSGQADRRAADDPALYGVRVGVKF